MAEQLDPAGGGQVKDDKDLVSYWLKQIDRASSHEREWRERGRRIVEKYRNEKADTVSGSNQQFNILYANTEVKKGVMYQRTPVPDVRRRFLNKSDPAGREAAKILEQSLSYAIDSYDFDELIETCVSDCLLPGRGQARVRYVPTFSPVRVQLQQNIAQVDSYMDANNQPVDPGEVQQDAQGAFKTEQELVYEEVRCDYVDWELFRCSPVKRWDKVWWVAFGEPLGRDELREQFPQHAESIALNWKPPGEDKGEEEAKALVWMIWNKRKRQVVVVTDGYKDAPLAVLDDPLRLEGFFPCPRPIYSLKTTDTLIPVPDFIQYQEQAIELEDLTERIRHLVDALRRRGVYDSNWMELQELAKAGDNRFIGVKDWTAMTEKGGLANLWAELPIEGIAKVLMGLYDQRERVKNTIYELDGISDIMRGTTKATETLGAQELKSQYAGIRLNPRQGAVARFARDLLRLKSEIIAEHFSQATLQQMTGVELPTAQQKQMAEAAGQPTDAPSWEEVMAILKSDKLRGFRVDIETDSTVKPQADIEQRNRTEMLAALTGFLEKAIPAVVAGALPKKVAMELMMFGIRGFKTGPQLEQVLEEWAAGTLQDEGPQPGQPPGQPAQPDPMQQMAMQAQARTVEAGAQEAEAGAKKAQAEAVNSQAKAKNTMAKGLMQFQRPVVTQGGLPQ